MGTLHVFLAHPKNIVDDAIDILKDRAERSLQMAVDALAPGTKVEVVTGRDDFMARSATEGGWDAWCTSVARGMTYRDNTVQPRYDLIVVTPSPLFGKGTSKIVSEALVTGKPVYYMRENGALHRVRELVTHDPNDYQNGWTVTVQDG